MGLVKTGIVQRRLMCGGLAEAVRCAGNRRLDIFHAVKFGGYEITFYLCNA